MERAGVEYVPLKELEIDETKMKDFFKECEGCQILWNGGNIMDMDVNTFSDAFLKVTEKYEEITHMKLPWGSIFMNEN